MNVQHDTKHAVILIRQAREKDPKSGDDHLNYRL